MLEFRFVKHIPDYLENRILYISLEYNTAIHLCACGCKNKVVTPISPIKWSFTFNGESISMYPSIGNWNFDCKSHYWIKNSEIIWAEKWDKKNIDKIQEEEIREIDDFYNKNDTFSNFNFFKKILSFVKFW
jgi:hypothetical protein